MLSTYLCQFAISMLFYGGLGLVVGLVLCKALLGKENYVSRRHKVMFVLFFVYAACVLSVTVMPLIGEYLGDDGDMHVGFIMEYSVCYIFAITKARTGRSGEVYQKRRLNCKEA